MNHIDRYFLCIGIHGRYFRLSHYSGSALSGAMTITHIAECVDMSGAQDTDQGTTRFNILWYSIFDDVNNYDEEIVHREYLTSCPC